MAKKRSAAARESVMFPRPPAVKLRPPKVVAFDPATNTITLDGPIPPALAELQQRERHRLEFLARFKAYHETCLRCVLPHYDSRPVHVPAVSWDDAQWRVRHVDLPDDAPGTAHDALLALRAGLRVVDLLHAINDWPDAIDKVFCELIDFGQLLQRMDDRRFEADVRTGQPVNANLLRTRSANRHRAESNRDRIRTEVRSMMSATPGLSKTNAAILLAERIEKEIKATNVPPRDARESLATDGKLVASLRTIKTAIAGWSPKPRKKSQ